ncbi:hypothetical protein T01_8107 [Trichinella spiralis]|uniref:Uncharacterized protein n=1 Tax=Trichinella spiralis TaxID=6334 RepID=A0A0V1BTD7_TRISP|nr:hypothetical protein T01_8107 [Trichinella spiralis]
MELRFINTSDSYIALTVTDITFLNAEIAKNSGASSCFINLKLCIDCSEISIDVATFERNDMHFQTLITYGRAHHALIYSRNNQEKSHRMSYQWIEVFSSIKPFSYFQFPKKLRSDKKRSIPVFKKSYLWGFSALLVHICTTVQRTVPIEAQCTKLTNDSELTYSINSKDIFELEYLHV